MTFVSRGPGKARYRPRPRLADKRKSIFSGFCMKTRNYAPAMAPAAGVRAFLNNFFRILRLFTLILLSASEDLTVSGGGREREECEPCVPGWRPSAERDPGRACATLRSLCGKDSGRSGMGDWLSGRAPRSHRGGHWFDPSIAHPVLPTRSRQPRCCQARCRQARCRLRPIASAARADCRKPLVRRDSPYSSFTRPMAFLVRGSGTPVTLSN